MHSSWYFLKFSFESPWFTPFWSLYNGSMKFNLWFRSTFSNEKKNLHKIYSFSIATQINKALKFHYINKVSNSMKIVIYCKFKINIRFCLSLPEPKFWLLKIDQIGTYSFGNLNFCKKYVLSNTWLLNIESKALGLEKLVEKAKSHFFGNLEIKKTFKYGFIVDSYLISNL